MTSEELNKIKQLFATDDLSNHILGALLYLNNGEGRTYQKLFWLIVNDRNGWQLDDYNVYGKKMFDIFFSFKVINDNLFHDFSNSNIYLWNLVEDNLNKNEIYKLFQDTWEDLIEKHCKY